ncbi:MAG: 1,4-dihydroxy-6-naphthoate synthase [Thermodesulfovibrionales bacterium]|nr:1,4-dihydroxy-6-naphthoate synthase [Thermodesulfovibrionales bacterium]
MKLTIGFSSCPNDTLIFYGLVNKKIESDIIFKEFIEDVETLNERAISGDLDVTKVSVAAYLKVKDKYELLNSGAAIGRGCGPLIVTKELSSIRELQGSEIAIPGRLTTANLLFKAYVKKNYGSFSFIPKFMTFDKIIPSVCRGDVKAGIIIHESRFTYEKAGLMSLIDLGEWWEKDTGLPIPLGCLIAKKSLGKDLIKKIDSLIHNSVIYGLEHLKEVLPYIKSHSQELSEDVIMKHIRLYVNDFTIDMGSHGREAIERLKNMEEVL